MTFPHLDPSQCRMAAHLLGSSGHPFSPLQGQSLPAAHRCLSVFSLQHFKQLVDELQAKGVGTVNKALTESFKILREVRGTVPTLTLGTSAPAHPCFPRFGLAQPQEGREWYSWVSKLWQTVCKSNQASRRFWLVHDALELLNLPRMAAFLGVGTPSIGATVVVASSPKQSAPLHHHCCNVPPCHGLGAFWLW